MERCRATTAPPAVAGDGALIGPAKISGAGSVVVFQQDEIVAVRVLCRHAASCRQLLVDVLWFRPSTWPVSWQAVLRCCGAAIRVIELDVGRLDVVVTGQHAG